jgi:hypothetical protein
MNVPATSRSREGRVVIGLQDLIVLLGALSLIFFQLENFADDPGVGWHLKTGEFIASFLQIPDYDPFLSYGQSRAWVSDQWFADLCFHLLYRGGGWPLLYGILTVVYLSTYFGLLYTGVARQSGSLIAATIGAFFAFKIGQLHFILRAAMIGFLFFVITYRIVYTLHARFLNNQGVSKRFYLVVPLLFCLWANCHPSFALGLVLISFLPLSLVLDHFFLARVVTRHSIGGALMIVALAFFATIVNPYGIELHESITALSKSSYFMNLHEEWQSPNFKEFEGQLFLLIMGTVLTGAFLGGSDKLRWGFFEYLLVGTFAYFGLTAVRMLPFFGIALSVPVAQALCNLRNCTVCVPGGKFAHLPNLFRHVEEREASSGRGLGALALVVIAICSYAAFRGAVPLYTGSYGPSSERYPYGALTALNMQSEVIHPVVAAGPEWGGFITFQGREGMRAIIDDRNTLLGEDFYKSFYAHLKPGASVVSYLQGLGSTHLLLSKNSHLAPWIIQGNILTEIYRDEQSVLFAVPAKEGE